MLALVKISALLFLLRLISGGSQQLACRGLVVFNAMQLPIFLTIALLQCVPLEGLWTMSPTVQCIRRDVYSIALAVTNIFTDVLTLLVPYCVFLDLKMNRRARHALMSVFMLGIMFVSRDPHEWLCLSLTLIKRDNHLGRPTLLHCLAVLLAPGPRHALCNWVHHVLGRDQPRDCDGICPSIVATGTSLVPRRL